MIRHALVQFKPHKHQLKTNLQRLGEIVKGLEPEAIDVLCLPETALTGYYLQGGVREQALSAAQLYEALADMLTQQGYTRPLDICLGFYEMYRGDIYNSALYAEFNSPDAGIRHVHRKMFVPTYGVFDEDRYVARGHRLQSFTTRFGTSGMLICEDAWHATTAAVLALKGTEILYVPMASPAREFRVDTPLPEQTNHDGGIPANAERWSAIVQGIATEHGIFVINTSLVGSEGGKGFVGYSQALNPHGICIAQGTLFEEMVLVTDIYLETIQVARYESPLLADLRSNLPELIHALQEAAETVDLSK